MSHKAKGLSRTSRWLSSFDWAGSSRLPCPSLLSSVPGPAAACRTTGPLGLKGGASFSFDPSCQYPPAGSPPHPASTCYRDSTAMCSPLKKSYTIPTNNKKYHRKHFPSLSSYRIHKQLLREISLKKKWQKIIKNQWNSNVRQSIVWTERGRQAFHHQQLPAKQLQSLLWNAP